MSAAPPFNDIKELMNACWDGNTAGINSFLDTYGNGAIEVTKGEPLGWTPLMWSARSGKVDSIRTLLDRGAAVNKPDRDGCTPLMQAAERGNMEAVQLLLERGADIFAVDDKDRNAAMLARHEKEDSVADLLEGIIAAHHKAELDKKQAEETAIAQSAQALQDDMRKKARGLKLKPGRGAP